MKKWLLVLVIILLGCTTDTALQINGEKVTYEQLNYAYVTSGVTGSKDVVMAQVVQNLINYRLMAQDAKNRGITVSDDEVEIEFERILNQNAVTEEQFRQILSQTGKTLEDFRNNIKEDLMINKALNEVFKGLNVTDEDVYEFYTQNFNSMLMPQQVIVRQIYLNAELHSQEEIAEVAEAVLSNVQEKDFCEVAEQYSDDQEKCQLYTISRNTVFPEYEQAAFTQDDGYVSIVTSEKGIHFIQTLAKLNYNPVSIDSVKDELVGTLRKSKQEAAFDAYISELRENAVIKNNLQK